jgi:hypothetical protein
MNVLRFRSVRIAVVLVAAAMLAGTTLLALQGKPARYRITRGGTYSGEFISEDARLPVIAIETAEPVIIEDATLRGRGPLIVSSEHHANITIRNTRGYGLTPNVAGKSAGRFASIERFDNVVIENCYLESTAGIYLLDYEGDRTEKETVRIIANRARNIDGRRSDGKGGYTSEFDLVQFAQLDKVRHAAGVEIAWNEIVNEPGASRAEDVISIYLSSGTAQSPIRIHNNYIRGAYPLRPESDEFSGGGIMCGDGVGQSPDDDPSFIHAHNNQVLDTVNYGIAISAGHDNRLERNRIFSMGVTPGGKRIAAQNVGAYVWDSYKAGKDHFFNNTGRENIIGWIHHKDGRNDWWTPDASGWQDNEHFAGALNDQIYAEEEAHWAKKFKAAGMQIGPK